MSERIPLNDHAQAAQVRRRVAAAEAGDEGAPNALRPGFVRKPFGNQEQRLQYPDRTGYHRHWFNDIPGRLMRAEEAGYTQVNGSDGKPVSMVVGISRGGDGLRAFLMEIPEEWYREDMAAQDNVVLDRLGQIKAGVYERPTGRDGSLHYAGSNKGDISIITSNRR